MLAETEVLYGTVEDIIYANSENGYTVFSIETKDDEVVCVGTIPDIHTGEAVNVTGNWTIHSTYGKQFQVQFYEKSMPESEEGIIKYLSSGVISGITLVFLPAVSSFFIPKLLGGGQYVLIGNVIENQFLTSGDWNFGSAISLIMAVIIMISMYVTKKLDKGEEMMGGGGK